MEYNAARIYLEDNQLIEDIIQRNYYQDFKSKNPNKKIELIINRTNSISKCYGCFNNTEVTMYPKVDFTTNNYKKIINNLNSFLNYYGANNWGCDIELTGIDWTNCVEIASEIMNNIYNNFENVVKQKDKYLLPENIIINLDCGFLNDNPNAIKFWINHAKQFPQIGINLFYKIHSNGLYCDDNGFNEEFYNKLFNFIKDLNNNTYQIISYIRPNNVDKWIENFDWWLKALGDKALTLIHLKEEKTDKWNYDLISNYILFLNKQIDYFNDLFAKNEEEKLKLFFNKNYNITFQNISLLSNGFLTNRNNNTNCGFFKNLTIDLNTMNIVPCAKVNYEDFACGQYMIENNNITGIKAKNIAIVIYNTHLKRSCMPHCEKCNHIEHCAGSCFGESYNKCLDMLIPIKEFCDLSLAKINYLLYKYNTMGLIDENKLKAINCEQAYITNVLYLNDKVKGAL